MKLSEMLGWEKKVNYSSMKNSAEYREVEAYNIAIESCDREIDREALKEALLGFCNDGDVAANSTEKFISTMPTWLKPTERK